MPFFWGGGGFLWRKYRFHVGLCGELQDLTMILIQSCDISPVIIIIITFTVIPGRGQNENVVAACCSERQSFLI
jgi:hypothetical protein